MLVARRRFKCKVCHHQFSVSDAPTDASECIEEMTAGILKNVIGIKALHESEGGKLEAMVRAVFKVLAGGKTRPRRKPNTERSSRR